MSESSGAGIRPEALSGATCLWHPPPVGRRALRSIEEHKYHLALRFQHEAWPEVALVPRSRLYRGQFWGGTNKFLVAADTPGEVPASRPAPRFNPLAYQPGDRGNGADDAVVGHWLVVTERWNHNIH
jgi:hypothetical protein